MQCLKKAILLTCGVLLLLTSYPQGVLIDCALNNYTEKYKVVDKKYKSENDYLIIDVIIPVIENNEGNPNIEKLNNKIIKWTEDWINDVKKISDEYFKGLVPPQIGPYQLYSRYKVTNSQNITSFYIDYYQFTGGAHGITTRLSYSVDNKTGKELQLSDLFKSGYDYKKVINFEIANAIQMDKDKYFTGKDGFNGISENQGFYLSSGNVVIYFQVYEIAPYVTGIPEFYISVEKFDQKGLKYELKPYTIRSALL